jgi:hypothetical protein
MLLSFKEFSIKTVAKLKEKISDLITHRTSSTACEKQSAKVSKRQPYLITIRNSKPRERGKSDF